ncbi:hypothetical protein CA983_40865, partial [Streptomyces swartbergensis]
MTAVVFVHGTGVREPALSALVGRVTAGLAAQRGGLDIVPYDWGTAHGATLAAGGASLPPRSGTTRGTGAGPASLGPSDETTAAWAVLYDDPYAELASAAAASGPVVERPPGTVPPQQRIRALLTALAARGDEPGADVGPGLARAATDLAAHPL